MGDCGGMTACYSATRSHHITAAMFFQLSLPSTPLATDAVGDPALPELGTAGTLTIQAQQDAAPGQVARLLAARVRGPREALRVRVASDTAAAETFTAPPLAEAPDDGLARLQ